MEAGGSPAESCTTHILVWGDGRYSDKMIVVQVAKHVVVGGRGGSLQHIL